MSDDQQADYPRDTSGPAGHGLSVNAVRHKISRGTLSAVEVNGEWRVRLVDDVLPGPAAIPRTGDATVTPDDRPADSPLISAQHQVDVIREGLVAPRVALAECQQGIIAEHVQELGRVTAERDHVRQPRDTQESRVRAMDAHTTKPFLCGR